MNNNLTPHSVVILSQAKDPDKIAPYLLEDPGFIYIVTNEILKPHIVKIGLTRDNPNKRVQQLSNQTAIPLPFTLRCVFEVYNCGNFEKDVHSKLRKYRVIKNKEFFEIPWFAAAKEISYITKLYKRPHIDTWPAKFNIDRVRLELEKLAY